MLAEVTTTAISRQEEPDTFSKNVAVAKRGGTVAKNARKDIESQIGESVISPLNAKDKNSLEIKKMMNSNKYGGSDVGNVERIPAWKRKSLLF